MDKPPSMIIILFLIGILEAYISSLMNKSLIKNQTILTGVSAFIYILTWWFILKSFVDNINGVWILLAYATGFSLGWMFPTLHKNY